MEIKINLVPPVKKEEIKKNNRLKVAIKIELVMTMTLLIFFAALLSFRHILNLNLSLYADARQKSAEAAQYEKIKDFDDKFNEINSQAARIASVKKDQLHWSSIFLCLDGLVFSNIKVKSLATSDYSATLSGIADTRDDLILFKEKMEREKCFSDIDLPLSNLVDKDNVEFKINFNINKDCLNKNE